uniref:Uncharacterized protein n=1 Tax=Alexandrium catenella TaxID=2925 RepID=A0A7S1RVB9_ALECA
MVPPTRPTSTAPPYGSIALWSLFRRVRKDHYNPEDYAAAGGEMLILAMIVSWTLTFFFNPEVIEKNALKDRVGYNNLCVGFDTAPARYVAMPLLVLQAVLAGRYSYLDTVRLIATRASLTRKQYYFAYWINTAFALWMLAFPMLLVITADFMSWATTKIHLFLFMGTLIIMWGMIAGNVYEAKYEDLQLGTKVWFAMFTAHTVLLPVVGAIDVLSFHPDLPADQIYTIRFQKPSPPVPWPVTAYLDYGWFLLLLLTIVFLPEAPPVQTLFECDACEPRVFGQREGELFEKGSDSGSGESESENSEEASGACA